MFLREIEITPELEEELSKVAIIVAHDRRELRQKSAILKDSLPVTAAGQMLDYLLRQWRGSDATWAELRGKKILDLGSGSVYSRDIFDTFYPHFSRLCAVNGAKVVGIDVHSQSHQDEKLFTGIKTDIVGLVMEEGLHNHPALLGSSFDIIHSQNFVGWNAQPAVKDYLRSLGVTQEDFENRLLEQCGTLLSEGGIMTIDRRDSRSLPIFYGRLNGQISEYPYTPAVRVK